MNILYRFLLMLSLVSGSMLLTTAPVTQAASELSAQEAVDIYISGLLSRMDEIKPLYESDRASYFSEVEVALSEFVDFREVARGVMAKYSQGSRGATEEQLDRFAGVFRESLVDFYGSALAEYGGVEYEFLENRRQDSNPERSSNVRMAMISADDSRIEVQYTMFLNEQREWKLRNLYVEGVNLRRQYHSRFDSLMNSNEFDIDRVIDLWHIVE